ncbi:MAG: TetR/AcrR family transcriptional regulator C-terminal domain-containing protein [Actinomycetota bacterium]
MTDTDSTTRSPLTKDTIVTAAVTLADAEGVRGVTMRKLAHSMGYEVMSLYNHVANKGELLDLMVDSVATDVATPEPSTEPMAAVRGIAVALREALVLHPWAPELWLRQMPGPERSRVMEDLLRFFDASDLPPELAHHGFHAVNNHVIGYTIQQIAIDDITDPELTVESYLASLSEVEHRLTIAHVHQHLDGETSSSFELVLDLILDGLVGLADSAGS